MGLLWCCCCCCFNNLLAKTLEIFEIVFQSFSLFFLLLSLIIIKWSNLTAVNLILFILMFIITLIILIFIIFIRYWRSKGVIKTTLKKRGIIFVSTCFGLTIVDLIVCIIEEFIIILNFYKVDYPCRNYKYESKTSYNNYSPYYKIKTNYTKIDNGTKSLRKLSEDINCANYGQYYDAKIIPNADYTISYLTFSYLEIAFIFGIWILYILRRRIVQGLDGPAPTTIQQPVMYDQYGRQVVVVKPGDVVIMDGQQHVAMPIQNQPYNQYNNNISNNPYNNIGQSQNISNQVNPQIPDSQEYNLQEKANY